MDQIKSIIGSLNDKTSRRQALKGIGMGGLGLAALSLMSSAPSASALTVSVPRLSLSGSDVAILNFALNLEYLEAEFYTYATTGAGIVNQDIGITGVGRAGGVTIKDNPQVQFSSPIIQQYAAEIGADERAHVAFIRGVILAAGHKPVARPAIDLKDSFTAAAQAAGIIGAGETFDPFANDVNFLLGAFIFEDVGVTAYRGAAPLVADKSLLSAAAGILGTEAYHAGVIRASIINAGDGAMQAAQKISDLRDVLDGTVEMDQGVGQAGAINAVPTYNNGLVFARTVRQVLNIVYAAPNGAKGLFFPAGVNSSSV